MPVKQVSPREFPSGNYQAVAEIALGPEELTVRFGTRFEDDIDGLGDLKFAFIELPSGALVLLKWYPQRPEPAGITAYADADADRITIIRELLDALELNEQQLNWYPEPETRGWKTFGSQPNADAWSQTFKNARGAEPANACPLCGARDLHRRCLVERPLERLPDWADCLGYGQVWEWCGSCRYYNHYANAIWSVWTTGAPASVAPDSPLPFETKPTAPDVT